MNMEPDQVRARSRKGSSIPPGIREADPVLVANDGVLVWGDDFDITVNRLVVIITNRCNLACPHCLRDDERASLSYENFKYVVDSFMKKGCETFHVTGGEPFLHPEYDRIISYLQENNLHYTVMSNGTNISKYLRHLDYAHFDHITFSLDGSTPETHDGVRGKGSFEKICRAINDFAGRRRVQVQMCLGKHNMHELEDALSLADSLGCDCFRFMSIIPTEVFADVLGEEDRRNCLARIKEAKKTVGCDVQVLSSLHADSGVDFCKALDLSDMAVNPKGELIFCCDTLGNGATLGDVVDEEVDDLLLRGAVMGRLLREHRRMCIAESRETENFNTCVYCNQMLSEPGSGRAQTQAKRGKPHPGC